MLSASSVVNLLRHNPKSTQNKLKSHGSHTRLRSPEPSGYVILCALLLRKLEDLLRLPELYELAKQKERGMIDDIITGCTYVSLAY